MHNYKNYIHLEGTANGTPSMAKSGDFAKFKLVVTDESRDRSGLLTTTEELIDVEIWGRGVPFAQQIRQGAPLVIDGTLRFRTVNVEGIGVRVAWVKAHRVFTVVRGARKPDEKNSAST